MMGIKYLSEAHLKGFERYKYNCVDTNILSIYVMHPFWNQCVKLFPTWIAPNLITFIGFLLTVINFLLIGYYDWDFTAANEEHNPIPRWVWFVAALNIFAYYTLDGIDGKQARRTGTSSPLGELFDHGLDSYSTGLIPIYMFSLFGTNDLSPLRMYLILWNVYINFYLAHVEKYNTGIMYLPWGYDFTMWGVIITLLLTCIFGPELWKYRLPYGYSCANLFEFTLYVSGAITNYPFVILNIYRSYKNRTGKMRPFMEALRPMFPFLWLFFISLFWIKFSKNDILYLETRIVFVLLGTIFSNFASRLIVSQMTDTRTDGFNILIWPLCIVILITCFPFYIQLGLPDLSVNVEKWLLYFLTSITTIAHIHYGQGVVREMCDHFHIKCFKDRYQLFINTLDKNLDRLTKALLLLDWTHGYKVSSFYERYRPAVLKVVEDKKLEKEYDSLTVLYYLPRTEATKIEIDCPPNIILKPLSEDDAVIADELWPNRHEGSLFFLKRLIKLNPNIGAYTKDSGELVAWCFRLQAGPLGALQVKETHKRQGLGSLVTKAMGKILADMDHDTYALVNDTNWPSRSMFEKLGFKVIDNVIWLRTYPTVPFHWKDE